MNILINLKYVGDIIEDLDSERDKIIIKHVLPLLSLLSDINFTFDNLLKIFPNSLGDLMNLLLPEHIECILKMNRLNVTTIEEFVNIDWEHFNNLGYCEGCEKLEVLLSCEGEHDDECAYTYSTLEKGCGRKLCDDCVGLNCEEADQICEAIRCENCFKH